MNVYASDQEQIQLLKDWWKKYGTSIILGLSLSLIASFGWRYWQQHQTARAEQASALYEQMLISQAQQQPSEFNLASDNLIKNYPRTPYAALAALQLADNAVVQNNFPVAEQQLQWASQHGSNKQLKQIATLRLARLLLAENKPQQALQTVQQVHDKNFAAAIDIVQGDILFAMNNKVAAKAAYKNALENMPANATIRSLVQMKFDNL